MQKRAAALAVLVVGASLVALVPASATADPAPRAHDTAGEQVETQSQYQSRLPIRDRTPPDLPEQWQRTHGEDGNDTFADLVRTDDGGYLVVGWTERDGNDDGWAVKIDGEGDQQWAETFGGDGTDRFRAVAPTDEGYLLAGRTDQDSGPNGWIVEIDRDGDVVRERVADAGTFNAVVRDDGAGSAGAVTDDASNRSGDAGYLLAGWTRGDGIDGWLVKLDGERERAWQTNVSTPEEYGDGYLRAVVPTDSGYYLAGKLEGDSDDGWALKVDAEGEREWATAVGGSDRDDVWAAAPAGPDPANDGFVLAGETESDSDGPRDGWLVAFGPDGEVTWERTPGGEGVQWLDSAMRTDDGFLVTGGSNQGPYGSADGYVVATDDAGEVRSESYYGTPAWDKPWPAVRAHDGGYLLAGKTTGGDAGNDNGWLVKIGESATSDGGDSSAGGTSDGSNSSAGEASETADGTAGANQTSDAAIQGDTPTATDAPRSVPGFGVGAALVALAAALIALRR